MSKKKLTKEEKRKLKKIKPGRLTKRDARMGLLFISPWILGALVFLLYPLISSFWYALNNIRMTPLGTNYTFVGQGNFTQILLSDAEFPTQLINYVVSTVISVPIIVVFALLISIMLTAGKLAGLSGAERKQYESYMRECHEKLLKERQNEQAMELLSKGYRVKVRFFATAPKLYLWCYHFRF